MHNFHSIDVTDYYDNSFWRDSDHYVDYQLLLAKKANKKIKDKNFVFVCTMFWEPYCLDEKGKIGYINMFNSFAKKNIKTLFVLDTCYEHIDTSVFNTTVFIMPYFLWLHHYLIFQRGMNTVSKNWNSESTTFLALTGKPHKNNRIRLLWKLHKAQLLQHSIWSLFIDEKAKESCRKYLQDVSEEEYANFINEYAKKPDTADIQIKNGSLHYIGMPYDTSMFDDCLFRVISETKFRENPGTPEITEKTYHTIFNNLPFIMAGDVGSLEWLKKQGYKTFENYLPNNDYDLIVDEENRLDAIVNNCKHWMSNMDNISAIRKDVKHNYDTAMIIVKQTNEKLKKLMDTIGLSGLGPEHILIGTDWVRIEL